jgi:glyoxylate reductase
MKPKVFVTRRIAEKALKRIEEVCDLEIWSEKAPPPYEIILEKVKSVEGLLTLLTDKIDQHVISSCSSDLKVISQMAVGYDNIDVKAATSNKIPVGHTPGVLTETTADFTFGLLLSASRRIVEADKQVHKGVWEPWGPDILTGQEVFGATLGIIGFGRIGQAIAKRANGFGMRVLYYDREPKTEEGRRYRAQYSELDELLAQSDFVTLHTNLSEQTFKFFNKTLFEKMKSSSILINTSRGGVINTQDLIWALDTKRIRGAALDVFEIEPIPSNHPLCSMENVIITPHIASASIQTRERMAEIAAQNLIAGIHQQKLPFCANPDVYC